MASSPTSIIVPSLDNSYGSIYIGMVVAAGLWGIGTAQAYWYFTTYSKDSSKIKLFVSVVWIVDTVHQALITYLIYYYIVTNYFNPLRLDFEIWAFNIQSLFEVIPSLLVQSFFLMRIWRLSNEQWVLVILPGILIVTKFVLAIVWIILCFRTKSVSDAEARFHKISEAVNGLAAAGDILLASTMVWLLYHARTGIRQSDNLLAKLMIYTVNTGVITSVCSIITLIVAVQFSKTYIYGAFYFCIGRLYVNTMLASLNARKNLAINSTVVEMTSSNFNSTSTPIGSGGQRGTNPMFVNDGSVPHFKKPEALDEFVAASPNWTKSV